MSAVAPRLLHFYVGSFIMNGIRCVLLPSRDLSVGPLVKVGEDLDSKSR